MRAVIGLGLVVFSSIGSAAELRDVRVWASPDSTRVVFDLSESAQHSIFTLDNPHRIVIDLSGVRRAGALRNAQDGKGLIQRIRSAPRGKKDLRVVLDMSEGVTPRSFSLEPGEEYGFRVVVDLHGAQSGAITVPVLREAEVPRPVETVKQVEVPRPTAAPPTSEPRRQAPPVQRPTRQKPIVVAIDAGHGGEDLGAKGVKGVLEKNVALAMARKLARLINDEGGLKAVLIRDGDYYVGLRERMAIARKHQADLFVSVHANAYHDRSVRGSAVYTLSQRGATSEHARWLAHKENASDLIGGVDINDKDDLLAAVLIDISQTSAIEASLDVGGRILSSLGQVNRLQKGEVQQAGFLVLKAPDIPSVLVETAFISNPQEEKLLADPEHQEKFARQMLAGIKGYFDSYRPLQQTAAADTLDVSSGDLGSGVPQVRAAE